MLTPEDSARVAYRAILKAIELSGVAPSRADVLAAVEKILAAAPPL